MAIAPSADVEMNVSSMGLIEMPVMLRERRDGAQVMRTAVLAHEPKESKAPPVFVKLKLLDHGAVMK